MTKLQRQTIEYIERSYGNEPMVQTIKDYVKTENFIKEVKERQLSWKPYKPMKFNTLFNNACNIIIDIYSTGVKHI